MAFFHGTVTGSTSIASRSGTRTSGLTTTAQSWKGSVGVELNMVNDEIMVEIAVAPDSSVRPRQVLFYGTLESLVVAGSLKAQG